jgi:hypothetical protein
MMLRLTVQMQLPGTGPRNDGRKKRALIAGFAGGGAVMAYVVLAASRFSAWEWVPLAVGLAAIAVAGLAGRPGGRGRDSSLRGRGRDDDDGPAGAAAHR